MPGGPTMPDTIPSDLRDLLAIHLVPGIGPRLTAALLERFGSAAAIRRASAAQLRQVPYVGDTLAEKLASALRTTDEEAELEKMARHNVALVALNTPAYPA